MAKAKKITFFQSLMERRVPQISGFYLGASWGLIQFIEWIVARYGLSPYLPDFSLVILFSLFPSVLMVAYFHGRPGDDEWKRIEKVSIPINLFFTTTLLVMFFSGKNLGAATETIVVKNEEGETIERVIAKSEFRKKIAIFNFKNNSGDTKLDWLESGFSLLLHLDMMQDPFLGEVSMLLDNGNIYRKLKKSGFEKGVDVPIGLLSKLARELHYQYFLTGSFKKTATDYQLTVLLYDSRLGKKIAENSLKSKNLMELVDRFTILTKKNLKIPDYHLESIQDLPVVELSSMNEEAVSLMVNALQELSFHNGYAKGVEYVEKAISLDPSFAMAHFYLGMLYANINQSNKSLASIKQALKYDYKLPETLKFVVKDMLYLMSGESSKRLNLVKMQVSLDPENIDTRLRLVNIYSASKKYTEAILEMESIMAVAPSPDVYLDDIGFLYLQLNKLEKAEQYFLDYAEEFPAETTSFRNLAYLYYLQGKDELVKENHEKSLFLEPDNLNAKLSLASLDEKAGLFDKANQQYQSALSSAEEPVDRFQVFDRLVNYHQILGQPKKAFEWSRLASIELRKFRPPLNTIINDLLTIGRFIDAGEKDAAFELLEQAEKKLQPPFDKLSSLGYSLAYLRLEQPKPALKYIKVLEDAITSLEGALQGISFIPMKMRGQVSEFKQDYPQALIEFQIYADNSPLDVTRFGPVGRIYRKMNNFDAALELLKKQYTITPFYPELNHELGLLFLAMDDKENALKYFKIAAEVWKNAEEDYHKAKENQFQLDKLLAKK